MNTRLYSALSLRRLTGLLGSALLLFLLAGPAFSAERAPFEAGYAQFYASYRSALFVTNQGDAAKAALAMDALQARWEQGILPYRDSPPADYAKDPQWKQTLSQVEGMIGQSRAAVRQGDLAKGHEVLEGIRDAFSDLRKRNGVVVFSDHVNRYHEEMEEALTFGSNGAAALDDASRARLAHLQRELGELAERVKANAPAEYAANPEFKALLQANFKAIERLGNALQGDNNEEIAQAALDLKPPYAKLFLKFG